MDDAELVRRLRNMNEYEPLGLDGWEAADRIEALIAERDAARDAALEEAAKLVEESGYTTGKGGERRLEPVSPVLRGMDQHHATISAAIRALKGKRHE